MIFGGYSASCQRGAAKLPASLRTQPFQVFILHIFSARAQKIPCYFSWGLVRRGLKSNRKQLQLIQGYAQLSFTVAATEIDRLAQHAAATEALGRQLRHRLEDLAKRCFDVSEATGHRINRINAQIIESDWQSERVISSLQAEVTSQLTATRQRQEADGRDRFNDGELYSQRLGGVLPELKNDAAKHCRTT